MRFKSAETVKTQPVLTETTDDDGQNVRKFKVKFGTHTEVKSIEGKDVEVTYHQGDVVETMDDLCTKFLGKFEEVTGA